jgi:hypothetical protein
MPHSLYRTLLYLPHVSAQPGHYHRFGYAVTSNVKVKQPHYRPGQALRLQEVKAPRFLDNGHFKVLRLSALLTGRVYPPRRLSASERILSTKNSNNSIGN